MDIRHLTESYAVSPQIGLDDLPRLKALGFTDIIDNRPDSEIPPQVHSAKMRDAAQAAGLNFHANPVIGGAITEENVRAQAAAITGAKGGVFAYCASGNRSSIVWALAHRGRVSADELIETAAKAGYNLQHLRDVLSAG